ncbi:nitroreductase family protein [Xanthomonas sp. NCPPB 1638]|nr:hypothetical protein EBN15_16080 [Xanthomonas cucurbitae]
MWPLSAPDPKPRLYASTYSPVIWPASRSVILEPGSAPLFTDLAALWTERRSHMDGVHPALDSIGAVLWHVSRTLAKAPSPYGFPIERRPVPSAGALHPVHILVQLPQTSTWARYNPQLHCLDVITDYEQVLEGLLEHAQSIAENRPGAYLAFVGEPGRLSTKYENHESLLWRDAGILQGNICLAAQAHGLGVCLLGVTGHQWIGRLAQQGQLVGVGLARIYARA